MDAQDIQNVQQSFARVFPHKAQIGQAFYQRFFAMAPELRSLFPANMSSQNGKFVEMLALLLRSLGASASVDTPIRHLADRHRLYGVQPDHFAVMGEALIATLQEASPQGLSPEEEASWRRAFAVVSQRMIAHHHTRA